MKRYPLAIVLVVATILSGCSHEENSTQPTPNASPAPLMVSVGVDRLTSKSGVVTGEAFSKDQRINVILVDATAANTPGYPAMSPYICSITDDVPAVTTWAPVDPTKIPIVMVNKAFVLAHYPDELPSASTLSEDKRTLHIEIPAEIPYGKIGDLNFNAVAMEIDKISAEVWFAKGDEDYMTGYGGEVSSLPSVLDDMTTVQNKSAITMKHALAMVVVQIQMDDANPDKDKTIAGLWVKNTDPVAGPLQKGSVNLADNAFTPSGARIDYSRPMENFAIAGNHYFGLLAYPATIGATGDVEIVCSAGAAQYTYKVPAVEWKAGFVYLYTLKLTSASGMLDGGDGVKVVEWPASSDTKVDVE